MSTTYSVVLSLSTTGSLDAKLGSVGSAAEKVEKSIAKVGSSASTMGSAMEGFGNKMGSVLDSVIGKVADVGIGLAKWGGAGLLAGAVYGVASLNAQLETTQISLGAIFQAQGLTGNFEAGMTVAADQIAKMKTDVMTLPGTFSQLAALMQTTATTGIAAGMNADDLRKFSGETMLTASIVAPTIDNNLLSKEIVNLLAGKAGTHNILGLRLGLQGDEAKKFNALSNEDRWKDLEARFAKYKDAAAEIGNSWKAQLTSLKDNVLFKVMQPITEPLFNTVKADLIEVNEWFKANEASVQRFTWAVGNNLARAWDSVVDGVKKLEPVFEKIAAYIENFDGSQFSTLLKRGALGAIGVEMLPSAMRGIGAGAGALAGVEGAGALAGPVGLTAGVLGFGAVAAITAGAVYDLTDKTSTFHSQAVGDYDMITEHGELALKHTESLAAEGIKPMGLAAGVALSELHDLTYGLDTFVGALDYVVLHAKSGADDLAQTLGIGAGIDWSRTAEGVKDALIGGVSLAAPLLGGFLASLALHSDDEAGQLVHRKQYEFSNTGLLDPNQAAALNLKPEQRNFGTTIQKVEIVVKGSDDPSRVAKSVLRHLQELQKHRTSNHPLLNGLDT